MSNWTCQVIVSFLIIILTTKIAVSGSECKIDFGNEDTPFAFVEIKENLPVGSLLGNYTVYNVLSVEIPPKSNNSFIDLQFNEKTNLIYFYLKRPLIEYREEIWTPSIELNFNITCLENRGSDYTRTESSNESTIKTKTYTFMSLIEDCNLYAPKFTSIQDEFNISFPWALNNPLNDIPIPITDIDYNKNHSTVEVKCEGDDCKYFDIVNKLIDDSINGHNYEVNIYLKEDLDYQTFPHIEVGLALSILLVANDSMFSNEAKFKFIISKVSNQFYDDGASFPTAAIAGGASAFGIVCAFFMVAFGYTSVKNRKAKKLLRKLTETEIREFLDGTAGFSVGAAKRSIDVNTPIMAMPYNKAFEISRDKLKIDETTVLGTGFFGIVMKGSITQQNGESIIVAVKAVKRNVGVLYFKALLSELKIMSFIGKHSNIVSLIGACTHNIRKREVFIAVQYCSNGNLHNFLKTNRNNFINLVKDGKICGVPNLTNNYAYERRGSNSDIISTLGLIKWSHQTANGLEYLASLGVIHGDLATRNILLDSEKVAKIADFGLSRRLVDISSYYYTKQSQAPLPWKWMSPESLKDMKFSKMSDIWSFGIVLWEIFTLGQTPYPGLNWSEDFVERLEKGFRLGKPQFAPDSIYEIMCDCWTSDPHHRPIPFDIKKILEGHTNTLLQQTTDEGYLRLYGGDKFLYIGDNLPEKEVNYKDKSALLSNEC